jgi:membrane protein
MRMESSWDLVKTTMAQWSDDKVSRLAAALSYYTIFSLAPLLIICISITGLIFRKDAVEGQVLAQLGGLLGQQSALEIQTMIASVSSRPSSGMIASIIGIFTLIIGVSGLFGELQDSFDTIWGVKPKTGRSILDILQDRFLSFTMILGIGFLLLSSLLFSALLTAIGGHLSSIMPAITLLWLIIDFIISIFVTAILFALIFKILPDVILEWRDVWLGAFVTSLLFTIGKFALVIYLGTSQIASTYGAAGSLIVILIWVYYSAQILLIGAEFTKVFTKKYGSHGQPSENAVSMAKISNN